MGVELLKDQIQKSQGGELAKITDSLRNVAWQVSSDSHCGRGLVGKPHISGPITTSPTYQETNTCLFTIPSDKVTQFQLQDR